MTIESGSKITIGLLNTSPEPDDLIRVANRIVDNIFLVGEAVETVARFITTAAEQEGVELEWDSKERKFRRAT